MRLPQNKFLFFIFFCLSATGCQIGYLIRSSYDHLSMLSTRVPIEKALQSTQLSEVQKNKIRLSEEARAFSFQELQLKESANYTYFVQLDRPYVTYAVMASYKWKFEPFLWDFPIIGRAPYKGYYSEKRAQDEATELKKKDFDVFVRGVPAFSTLGKSPISDPLLSSMLSYKEHDLVNTVIHELVHTTLFIKDNIDFNERLAVFVANKGTEMFYLKKEGSASKTLEQIKQENQDESAFSAFITVQLDELKAWYVQFENSKTMSSDDKEKIRQERFELIKTRFRIEMKPKLKSKFYSRFADGEMNNAQLGTYQTYLKNLDDFEKVYVKMEKNIPAFMLKCAELNAVDDPEKQLHQWARE